MRLALAHPERVERLILASSASDLELGHRIWGAAVIGRLLPLVAPFTLHNRRFRELSLKSGYYDPDRCTEDIIEGYMLPARVRGYLRALGNTMAHWRRDPPLRPADIIQSTLILWGGGTAGCRHRAGNACTGSYRAPASCWWRAAVTCS